MSENGRHGTKEPFLHIVKKDNTSFRKALLIRFVIIVIALVVTGILTWIITGVNPFNFYKNMVEGSFGSSRRIWILLQSTAILLCLAVGLTPAFKMRFWNTGAEGQALIAGLVAAACMRFMSGLPAPLLILIMVVCSVAAGAVWAVIPAIFKAFWNTNETLFSLMMNYIAIQLTSFFIYSWDDSGHGNLGIINRETEAGWLPQLFGSPYLLSIVVVVLLTVFMFVYLKYSKHGYEINVVGESENTAKYIGINVKKVIIRTMLLSGAICGVAGLLLVAGIDHSITTDTIAGRGFTGIMVSWMAQFNPLVMGLAAMLIVFLEKGGSEVSMMIGLNDAFSQIVSGIIIFFIIGSEFFINYKIVFRHKDEEAKS